MSNEAINWALTRPIKHSTAKFVLVVMANCADGDSWEAWPSVAHLAEATGQDRKTVLENIKRLIAMGYITDTEQRKGATKQVPIYRLNSTETGIVKGSPNRDSTENGTVPKFPSNSPEIPYEQSRFSAETVPKTGHGTLIEPSIKPKGTLNTLCAEPATKPRTAKPKPSTWSDDFEMIWPLYPKKPGMSKADALKAFSARVNEGVSIPALQAGVQAYAAYVLAERTEPKYIKAPETFFGPGKHWESDWSPPVRGSPGAQTKTSSGNQRAIEEWLKGEQDHA